MTGMTGRFSSPFAGTGGVCKGNAKKNAKKNAKNVNLWLTKEREDDRIIFVAGTTGGKRNQIYQPLSFRKKPIKKI